MKPESKNKNPVRRSLFERAIYQTLNNFFRLLWMTYLGLRVFGGRNFPQQGAALICSNHQSHLDPILVGNACTRYIRFVARDTLFKNRFFGWLISSLGAFPINRDAGLSGIKATLKNLKNGDLVLIFPEGTRTPDGELKEFKPGFCSIARRARVPIVPVAIDGAYQAWPKSNPVPRPGNVQLKVGEPILYDQFKDLGDEEMTLLIQEAVQKLQDELKP